MILNYKNSFCEPKTKRSLRATTPHPKTVAALRHILIISQAPFHEAPTLMIPKALLSDNEVPGTVFGTTSSSHPLTFTLVLCHPYRPLPLLAFLLTPDQTFTLSLSLAYLPFPFPLALPLPFALLTFSSCRRYLQSGPSLGQERRISIDCDEL